MSSTAEQVLSAAMALTDEERLEVAEALFASLQSEEQPPFDDSWREVVRRRSAELRTGAVCAVPLDDVIRQAREKAGG
jgi:putative addiction module component (TIGR02574 family)